MAATASGVPISTAANVFAASSATSSPPTNTASTSQRSHEEIDEFWRQSRLSLPDVVRIPLATAASFTIGMGLGVAHGSTMAGMRFRAEHAHKLPTTTAGWYLYHKSKNYHVANGGIREGLRMGARVSVWTTAMFGIETLFDRYRGTQDLANTVLASVTVAGAFSVWNHFPLATAVRTTKTAILVGFAFGGLQDLASLARGRRVSYVDFLKRQFWQGGSSAEEANSNGLPLRHRNDEQL
ncbi:hypothetical protein SEPCBS57363_004179 [Sporothrix epigloea]|uniref:Uncharacterized protein n=1 Tax=Sporothrix epigloea TaxID=1892477 RepID=A0ABP0DSR8_9PEZI